MHNDNKPNERKLITLVWKSLHEKIKNIAEIGVNNVADDTITNSLSHQQDETESSGDEKSKKTVSETPLRKRKKV